MQGKQNIIDDILSTAKRSAAAMISEAEEESRASVEKLRAELDSAREQTAAEIKSAADAVYAGRVKLGELEAGKIMLAAKCACVDAVYDAVRESILKMSDADYLKMLARLITDVCADGDEIVAAKADGKRVTAEWVKKVSSAAKKKLALAKERGDFPAGVILRNAKYDRDLTLDEIISDLRDRTEAETVKSLEL